MKLKAVMKTDGLNAWWMLAFWFQVGSTSDSTSQLTRIMNPERADDRIDMMGKLYRWDAMVRDYEMTFNKDDTSDKVRQAAIHPTALEAMVWSTGSREGGLDTHEKLRGMVHDTFRDEREARRAIKLSGGSGSLLMEVDQLRLRGVVLEAPDEGTEGDGESSSGKG